MAVKKKLTLGQATGGKPGKVPPKRAAVQTSRQTAKQDARASGAKPPAIRQAGRQAAQQTRQTWQRPAAAAPAPAPAPAPVAEDGGGYALEYSPTAESQLNQPYQDMIGAGAYGSLADVLGRMGQQGDMADIYGQGAATQLGGAAAGMGQLAPLGGQYTGASGRTLGQYGQLMDPNLQIQQTLANQIQRIQSGAESGFDPLLDQQLGDQERVLREKLQRQLGGDYENSSAGIEALSKFNQSANLQRGTSRFNQLQGLMGQQQAGMQNMAGTGLNFGQFGQGVQGQQFGQGAQLGQMFGTQGGQLYDQAMGLRQGQLGGASALLNQTGQTQQLYNNIPQTLGQYGQAMAGMANDAVNAQQPYSRDRFAQLQASYAPSEGQMWGQMAAQSGDRWANIGGSMMGGMGGGGGGGGG